MESIAAVIGGVGVLGGLGWLVALGLAHKCENCCRRVWPWEKYGWPRILCLDCALNVKE